MAFPRMGTGVGRVPATMCARQMRAAFEDVLFGRFLLPKSWAEAHERHQLLYADRSTRLQHYPAPATASQSRSESGAFATQDARKCLMLSSCLATSADKAGAAKRTRTSTGCPTSTSS
jgi:hypothetical protein